MKSFLFEVETKGREVYRVEAKDEHEAKQKYYQGDFECVVSETLDILELIHIEEEE